MGIRQSTILGLAVAASSVGSAEDRINTVTGPIASAESGFALIHEHLFSTFGLDEAAAREQFDAERIFEAVVPRLGALKRYGVEMIVECTAENFGRDAELLRRLSEASGLAILTNTGIYGAADDFHISDAVRSASVDELAEDWTAEFHGGIGNTGIRPGFIKIGVDPGPLSEIDAKLARAAARTHRATGLTTASHTGGSVEAAQGQLKIFAEEGVSASAWIWTHAQNVKERSSLVDAASAGAWISLDGIQESTISHHLEKLQWLKQAGLLDKALLSHDGNAFPVGKEGGGRPSDALMRTMIPQMKESGFTEDEIDQLTVRNPRAAFTIKKRLIQ